jgi:hypothetical protein
MKHLISHILPEGGVGANRGEWVHFFGSGCKCILSGFKSLFGGFKSIFGGFKSGFAPTPKRVGANRL